MPFKSVKQMKYLAMNKVLTRKQLKEWASKTNMKSLPKKAKKK